MKDGLITNHLLRDFSLFMYQISKYYCCFSGSIWGNPFSMRNTRTNGDKNETLAYIKEHLQIDSVSQRSGYRIANQKRQRLPNEK